MVEILVQILQNTPIWNSEYPPPWKFDRDSALITSEYPPENLTGSSALITSEYPPWKLKFGQILALWLFSFRIPPLKIEIWAHLGTLTFQFQNTPPWKFDREFSCDNFRIPPPENWNLGRSWHFDFSVSEYPPPLKLKFGADLGT